MPKYRVIIEYFVNASDEYEAEILTEELNKKFKRPYNLIDVQQIDFVSVKLNRKESK